MANKLSYILAVIFLLIALQTWFEEKPTPVKEVDTVVQRYEQVRKPILSNHDLANCVTFDSVTSCQTLQGCSWSDDYYCSGTFFNSDKQKRAN